MNVKILITRIAIICVSLMVVGCQPLIRSARGNTRCTETVFIDMELAVEFYIENDSIHLKMFAKTPEGKKKKDIKLEPGMHIYLKGYANSIFIVEDISSDSVTLSSNDGHLTKYQSDESWDFDILNAEMLKYCKCKKTEVSP